MLTMNNLPPQRHCFLYCCLTHSYARHSKSEFICCCHLYFSLTYSFCVEVTHEQLLTAWNKDGESVIATTSNLMLTSQCTAFPQYRYHFHRTIAYAHPPGSAVPENVLRQGGTTQLGWVILTTTHYIACEGSTLAVLVTHNTLSSNIFISTPVDQQSLELHDTEV